jgi:predicted metalloprotease
LETVFDCYVIAGDFEHLVQELFGIIDDDFIEDQKQILFRLQQENP